MLNGKKINLLTLYTEYAEKISGDHWAAITGGEPTEAYGSHQGGEFVCVFRLTFTPPHSLLSVCLIQICHSDCATLLTILP